MPDIPYFCINETSFEKNAGYKSTVHALAELIDNAYEANATKIHVITMVNSESRLVKIAVADNGSGMDPELLQSAVCEKSGTHMNRFLGKEKISSQRKLGKYGVGLPKASISQCNHFIVWSWVENGIDNAYKNSIDIKDKKWIEAGAKVPESLKSTPQQEWIDIVDFSEVEHGTFVLWQDLDGTTWSRARWGNNAGLIPNLEFQIGRVYRKMIGGEDAQLSIFVHVVNESFRKLEDTIQIQPNDPLYLTKNCPIPRQKLDDNTYWPPEDPLFDCIIPKRAEKHFDVAIKQGGIKKIIQVTYDASVARKQTFARLNNKNAGNLPHGEHAKKNVGISFLRENREVDLSMVLTKPSEPRERWCGVEFNFPHELDEILGMINNKQSYTRLEQILRHSKEEYKYENETTDSCLDRIDREDPKLAICLKIAWKIREIWESTLKEHLDMREEVVGNKADKEKGPDGEKPLENVNPAEDAEKIASESEKKNEMPIEESAQEKLLKKQSVMKELEEDGLSHVRAEEIAERVIEKGLKYNILNKSSLGTPFFNVRRIIGTTFIELNEDHLVHNYLFNVITDSDNKDIEEYKRKLHEAKVCTMLILEAWAHVELNAKDEEKNMYQRMREDWGRRLYDFIKTMKQ